MNPPVQSRTAIGADRLDRVLHALSDRTRRALLRRLAAGEAMVTELAEPFAMSRIAVSKHLRVLEAAGLISRCVEGRIHRCSISPEPLREVERWLSDYRTFWTDRLEALARFAESGEAVERGRKR
ncbi:MAG TPA: metalloregulator ArsR/SmtB family transcription factor [Steroidobacteraceae bacterium]|nr:metalloregulator ArsR/SmtB family transcription factor [Steroidobacteraceae bacterium]